ncbi:hypothetical protein EOI86_02385 [Hwanghaeella grinnelliae]|uniref:Thioredoxin family protein n=2 Tax=Hwanghaeella grinnelliae TaxID=2500179 RepID=A0A437QYZ8_9PROT|nr:hypothetical protein EOI86_02385 [Hwanghaeella grinnelliae]
MNLATFFLSSTRLAALCAAVFITCWPALSRAADIELVMFERPFCEWCEAWNEEVGDAYAITQEGKFAPLRRVQLNDAHPADLKDIRWPRFTPTFVMMVDGEEVGRIRGYPGEEFFWGLLGELIEKARAEQ